MAASTSSAKKKGPIVDPALCRCCRSIKKCRLLTAEYEWQGTKEVYSDMIMDCFGLLLSHLDGDSKESCVCATCVVRLRDALAFRQQVLKSEEIFLNAKLDCEEESVIKTTVKVEPNNESDSDALLADSDDMPVYTNADSDSKIELKISSQPMINILPLEKKDVYLKKEVTNKMATRSSTSGKLKQKKGAKDLLGRMHKLKVKLDKMLEKPAPPQKKTKQAAQKKKKTDFDHEDMIYKNAVTIIENSYVCPFQNRISNYYCFYCKDQFTNPVELREHTLTHDPVELFLDSIEYYKLPKVDIARIDCRLCPEKIFDLATFRSHITTVHGKQMYPVTNELLTFKLYPDKVICTECNSSFPYFDELKKHMNEHFGRFICDQCGTCFLEQNSLRTHLKVHAVRVQTDYPCEICGKNLKSKYSRHLHVATVHEKIPTVNCYKCDSSFLSYALRNRHLIEVHGDKRTFPCKLCDKVYNRRKTLMEHNRRNHLKVFNHQCDLCDQRFYIPSRLKEHMATHTGERNFRCEFCDKSYPRLQSLQEHVRSHSNERRYKCDVCNTAFTQNGSLKSHMKSHHQGFEMDGGFN